MFRPFALLWTIVIITLLWIGGTRLSVEYPGFTVTEVWKLMAFTCIIVPWLVHRHFTNSYYGLEHTRDGKIRPRKNVNEWYLEIYGLFT